MTARKKELTSQEISYLKMLNVKERKGVRIVFINAEGAKQNWLLFPKTIIPVFIKPQSLLHYQAMTRADRRLIHKQKSK